MKDKLADRQRLLHIIEAITEIEFYTSGVELKDFLSNSMMRFASIKQIEIIGEAANYITADTKTKFTNVEWSKMIGMRHILVHEYFGVDFELVWQVVISDLPALKAKIIAVLNSLT